MGDEYVKKLKFYFIVHSAYSLFQVFFTHKIKLTYS